MRGPSHFERTVARDDCKTSHEKRGCKKMSSEDMISWYSLGWERCKICQSWMLVEFSLVEFGLLFHLSICHAFHNFLTSNKIYLLEVLQLLRWGVLTTVRLLSECWAQSIYGFLMWKSYQMISLWCCFQDFRIDSKCLWYLLKLPRIIFGFYVFKVCEGALGSLLKEKHFHNLKLSLQQDVLVEMNRNCTFP